MESLNTLEQLTKQTVIVSLNLGKPGNSKKVNQSEIEVLPSDEEAEKPNQEKLRVSKVLLDSVTLKEIGARQSALRKWLTSQCLPTKFIKRGMGIIKATSITKVTAKFVQERAAIQVLIDKFAGEYTQLVEESFVQLGGLAKVEDYMTWGKIESEFEFDWNFLTFTTPVEVLGQISSELAIEEQEKLARQMSQIVGDVEIALTQWFSEMVDYLKDHLTGSKKVSDKAVDRLNAFFAAFADKNLGTNSTLTTLVEQARDLVNGVSPEEMSTQGSIRDLVKSRIDEIKAAIDLTIVEQGERFISLPRKQPVTVAAPAMEGINANP